MHNPKSCNGGKEENDGMLVLRKLPLNIWQCGQCKCNNCRKHMKRRVCSICRYGKDLISGEKLQLCIVDS